MGYDGAGERKSEWYFSHKIGGVAAVVLISIFLLKGVHKQFDALHCYGYCIIVLLFPFLVGWELGILR